MALIKCPECGREKVSDSAEMCPDCGYGIKAHFDRIYQETERKRKEKEEEEQEKIKAEQQKELEEQERIRNAEEVEKKKSIAQSKLKKLEKDVIGRQRKANIYIVITVLCSIITIILYKMAFEHYDDIYIRLASILLGVTAFFIAITIRGRLLLSSAKEIWESGKNVLRKLENGQNVDINVMDRNPTIEVVYIPINGISNIGLSCPICRSSNVKRISTTSRAISVGTVGLASGKIGKQYQCKKCGHLW